MTFYLTVEDVLRVYERKIVAPALVREPGQVAATVGRPAATVFGEDAYPTVAAKAAALFHGFATTQAFVDGNKRMAVYAAVAFVLLNGYRLTLDDGDMYELTMRTSEGEMDVDKLTDVFDAHLMEVDLEP
jgi:death-on-curing protein